MIHSWGESFENTPIGFPAMTDVFISYSRKDKAFVQILNQALGESKYETWVDWEDIPLTAKLVGGN